MDVAYCGRPLGRKTWIVTPSGCGPGVDQIERDVRAGVREQARALPMITGNVGRLISSDQLVFEQPAHQGAASVHLQLTGRRGLTTALKSGMAFHAVETVVGIAFGLASALFLAPFSSTGSRRRTTRRT